MLTSGQCVIAAYLTDGDIICPDCAEKLIPVTVEQLNEGARWSLEIEQKRDIYSHEKWDCADWARATYAALEEAVGIQPLIQYSLDSEFSDGGASCGDCGCILVEADEPEEDKED
jgi:hypothetical protein